jgi:hypothetical protein
MLHKHHVRFGSKADICAATSHVRFTPNSDRESQPPAKVMSALPPKADMCGALGHVCFGPIADIATGNQIGDLRHVMSGHANNKQSNAETHRSKPSTRLRIQDLDPLYVVVSRSAPATTIVTNANRSRISIEPSLPSGEKPRWRSIKFMGPLRTCCVATTSANFWYELRLPLHNCR